MATTTYNDIKKIKIGDNIFVFHVPTASEVGALASNTTYVSTVTTTAGAHTTISSKSGAVSFNIPTKTSHLTNDSGFITSYVNTATAADNILDGSNSGTQITYAPYGSQQSKLSFDTSATNPTRTDRLNLNGYLYATKLYSGNKEVLTAHQTITKAMVTTALGTGSGTTKFLREDGSWATPAYIANTDAKLQVAEVTSATQYYPLVGTGTTAATRQYDTTGFKYKGTTGTTSAIGAAILELGNSTASGTAGNKQGQLIMYGTNAKKATITLAAPSADIALALPTSGGTLALTSQIPALPDFETQSGTAGRVWITEDNSRHYFDIAAGSGLTVTSSDDAKVTLSHTNSVTAQTTQALYPIKIDAQGHISAYGSAVTVPSITLNGSGSTSPSFYAPTSAGTSGYVLKSNGSGAPTWTSATLTDAKVTQTATTTSASYEILFSSTADNTTRTEGARKTSGLTFNPSSNELFIGLNTSATSGIDKEITDKLTTLQWLDVVS